MYSIEGNQIVVRSDEPNAVGRVVAQVTENADHEAALLLVSRANLADRDEVLFDEIADRIDRRNET